MPFTPLHMGPGIFIKAIMRGSFSLLVFGFAQIIMDIQPLIVMISGKGHLHGFSHTYMGATLIALFSALIGKYLSDIMIKKLVSESSPKMNQLMGNPSHVSWGIAIISALMGTFSHVFLDSIMHADVEPYFPITGANGMYGFISIDNLEKFCLYSGLVGGLVYFMLVIFLSRKA